MGDPRNYLLYLEMLRRKDRDEYNGMENFVMQQHDVDEVGFLPVGASLTLQNLADKEGGSDAQFQSSVIDKIRGLEEKLDQLLATSGVQRPLLRRKGSIVND